MEITISWNYQIQYELCLNLTKEEMKLKLKKLTTTQYLIIEYDQEKRGEEKLSRVSSPNEKRRTPFICIGSSSHGFIKASLRPFPKMKGLWFKYQIRKLYNFHHIYLHVFNIYFPTLHYQKYKIFDSKSVIQYWTFLLVLKVGIGIEICTCRLLS